MSRNTRKMPTPANDPTKRGKRRSDNIDLDDTMMAYVLERLKEEDSTDEEANWMNIRRILRAIPRNNPNDRFKPYSERAVRELAQGNPPTDPHQLTRKEEDLLQHFSYDMDRCTIFDKPNPSVKRAEIPKEVQFELNRFPGWLRAMIEARYEQLSKRLGEDTPHFLKLLARRLAYLKGKHAYTDGLHKGETEDISNYIVENQFDLEDEYKFIGEDLQEADGLRRENEDEVEMEMDPFRPTKIHDDERETERAKAHPDKREIIRLKLMDKARQMHMWSTILTHKAGDALRAALVAGQSETEDEDFFEEGGDEKMRKAERDKGVVRHKDKDFVYRGAHWESIIAERSGYREDAKEVVNEEFMRPNVLKAHRQKMRQDKNEERKSERRARREIRKAFPWKANHPLLKQSGERQKQATLFRERGVGKRPSRFFTKSPCDGPIVHIERRDHQSRNLESWRAYANFIVASEAFKYFIMVIIVGNAALLALETGEFRITYHLVFDLLDSFFLSVYFAEFLLKFFAFPNQYFKSGWLIFDFFILVASLIKAIADMTELANVGDYLRFLTIVRAFRILRGVSLSIHIQVLVRALLATLQNHVFGIVFLLVLLMYITSIVAFYLFGDVPGLDHLFGRFGNGMLRLFAFVTMDGWTVILDAFESIDEKHTHAGRGFCLVLSILGNFLFSNIFIAIIIMQISDATDAFRKTRADESDVKVTLKQDQVFRRQKLDMRQLLARQRLGVSDDFYELGSRFVRKLPHDDLTDKPAVLFSPLWIDALYKSMQRAHHTSNIIMNQHRKMIDRLTRLRNFKHEDKLNIREISRARYNRYSHMKSKLRLLKEQFVIMRDAKPKPVTKVRWKPAAASSKTLAASSTTSVNRTKNTKKKVKKEKQI